MRAVQALFSYPRYGYTKVAGMLKPSEFYGPRSCVTLREVPEPQVMGPHWVKLRSLLSGFCGSDLGMILLHDCPTAEPFVSFPCTLGHENVSVVEEVGSAVEGIEPGERVTVMPSLGCLTRDIDPPCGPCSRGQYSICDNAAEGTLAPGLNIGNCRDTGGGWGKYYIAHDSQIVKVPDGFSDEQAVTIETLASSMHPVLSGLPGDGQKVLVIGAGVIGLGVVACIRALGVECHITAVEPTPLNARKALEKGADEIIDPRRESLYDRAARITGAKVYKPEFLDRICRGGFDRVFDCFGSTASINQALRVAAGGATIVLIGIRIPMWIDWTPVWLKGLRIIGDLGYGLEEYHDKQLHTFDIVIDLMKQGKLDTSDLTTHLFTLDEYRTAIQVNMNKGQYGAIKTVFDLNGE
jgi:threonine dehydrogenase-like Zn-dependent dehydrogenase